MKLVHRYIIAYFIITGDSISNRALCTNAFDFYIYSDTQNRKGVRPIVTLKSDIIDIDAGYNEKTGWSLK